MKKKPLVSVITITYQAQDVLIRTLESVLCQTYLNIEYILVDGDSKDHTVSIIKSYENQFRSRNMSFRWISEPDKGIYDAMNKGIKMSNGEYLLFMNAGDKLSSEDCLELIFQGLNGGNSSTDLPDFIYGETKIVDEMGNIMGDRRLKSPEVLTWKNFKMGMLVCHQSMLVKKSIAPFYDLEYRYSSDFDWTIRCLKNSKIIHNTHLVLSHFLDGGVSKQKMRASLKERFRIMAKNYGWISTFFRHLWFVCRAIWFKVLHGWI